MELLKVSNEKYGQTLLVITHDESIALQADRILSVEDGAAVLIRDGKVEDIQKIEDYRYMGLPVVDERGMALLVKNKEDLERFLEEAKNVISENRSEVHNKWFRFETYRKVVCTDNFWVI